MIVAIIPIFSLWVILTTERCKHRAWKSLKDELFTEEIFRY